MKFIRELKLMLTVIVGLLILSGCADVTTTITVDQATSEIEMTNSVSVRTSNYDEDVTSEDVEAALKKAFSDADSVEKIADSDNSYSDLFIITYKFENAGDLNEYLADYMDGEAVTFEQEVHGNQVQLIATINQQFEKYIEEKTTDVHGLLEMGSTTADELIDSFDLEVGTTDYVTIINEYGEAQTVNVKNLYVKSTEYTANVEGKYSGKSGELTSGPVQATIILDPEISGMPDALVDVMVDGYDYLGNKMVKESDGLVRLDIDEYSVGGEVTCDYTANFIYADVQCKLPEYGFDYGLFYSTDAVFADVLGGEVPANETKVNLVVNGHELENTSMKFRDYKIFNIVFLILLIVFAIIGIIALIIVLVKKNTNSKAKINNSVPLDENNPVAEINAIENKSDIYPTTSYKEKINSISWLKISRKTIPFLPLLVAICGVMPPLALYFPEDNLKVLITTTSLQMVTDISSYFTEDTVVLKLILAIELIRMLVAIVMFIAVGVIIAFRVRKKELTYFHYKLLVGVPLLIFSITSIINMIVGVAGKSEISATFVNHIGLGLSVLWAIFVFAKNKINQLQPFVDKIESFDIYLLASGILLLFGSWANLQLDLFIASIKISVGSLLLITSNVFSIFLLILVVGLIIGYMYVRSTGNQFTQRILKISISGAITFLLIVCPIISSADTVIDLSSVNVNISGMIFILLSIFMSGYQIYILKANKWLSNINFFKTS